jgi:hypothetical protein
MSVKYPLPGTRLTDDYDDDVAFVIEPGWSDQRIRDVGVAWIGPEARDLEYTVATWRYHTKAQDRIEGAPSDYDWYWSPDGWGKSTIDVAIFRNAWVSE